MLDDPQVRLLDGVFWIQQGTLWLGRGAPYTWYSPGPSTRATELAASSLELLLHPHTSWGGWPSGIRGASSSDSFVFHVGHRPVFRVEAVNTMAPHSLGSGVNSIH